MPSNSQSHSNKHHKRDIFHRSSGVSSAGGSFAPAPSLNLPTETQAPRARGVDNYGISSSGYVSSPPQQQVYASAPASSPVYAHRKPLVHEECCSCGVGAAGTQVYI